MRASYLVALALTLTACSDAADGPVPCPASADGGVVVIDGGHFAPVTRPDNGECLYRCALGWSSCAGASTCESRLNDDQHCGSCSITCRGEYHCTATSSGSHECRAP